MDIGYQDSRLVNADNLARGGKVTLPVIVRSENLRRELGTFCYILTGIFGYACPYMRELKGLVDWAAPNRATFEWAVLTSHQVTDLLYEVSRLLSEYMNACVQATAP